MVACAHSIPALAQGGKRDAEIATPMAGKKLFTPDKMDTETAAPDGNATRTPTHRFRSSPRERISFVGNAPSGGIHRSRKLNAIKPNIYPVEDSSSEDMLTLLMAVLTERDYN